MLEPPIILTRWLEQPYFGHNIGQYMISPFLNFGISRDEQNDFIAKIVFDDPH